MHPRAIETRYKGYRFRSRLEARWAVFFDALGLRWEYEPEGFELPGGVRYLPDFRLHALAPKGRALFAEVKPSKGADDGKAAALSATQLPDEGFPIVLLLDGAPDQRFYDGYMGGKVLTPLAFFADTTTGALSLRKPGPDLPADGVPYLGERVTEALERSRGIRFVRNEQW